MLNARTSTSAYFVFTILLAAVIRGIVANVGFVYDDAYIVLRVARNLAQNGELVFNQGERVQTATSNLYALVLGLTYTAYGEHSLEIWRWLGGAADSVIAGIVYLLILGSDQQKNGSMVRHAGALSGALFYACLSTSIIPAVGGLETAFFALSAAGFFIAIQRGSTSAAAALSLMAMLLRPEGALIVGIFLFKCARETYDGRRGLLGVMSVIVVASLVYVLSVQTYFGTLLPQTALAKSLTRDSSAGWLSLVKPLYLMAATAPLAAASVLGIVELIRKRPDLYLLLAWTAGYVFCISFFGSWWPWYKPPVMVFYAISVGVGLNWVLGLLEKHLARQWVAVIAVSLGLGIVFGTCSKTLSAVRAVSPGVGDVGIGPERAVAQWIASNVPTDRVIMLEPLGIFGYYLPHKIHDYPGLASTGVTNALRRIDPPRGGTPRDVRAFSAVLEEVKPDVIVLRDNEWTPLKSAGKLGMYEEVYVCCVEIEATKGPYHVLYRVEEQ